MKPINRRKFVKGTALAGATVMLSPKGALGFVPPNETVNVAILGTGGRAHALAQAINLCDNIKLTTICDVDKLRIDSFADSMAQKYKLKVRKEKDFRKVLEKKDIDAVFVATPEHWHAPMAIMAMQAGKHVYVEKPCSHNLYENDLLVQVQKKYNKVCQMGNQQRSSVTSNQAINDIRAGKIGEVYHAKAWYSNIRGTIGRGKEVAVPDTLDWDLWQGPAPRENYRDNVHPYNWHWFRTWGTGEIHNNGTHEIDICRWALNVNFPVAVSSSGGRAHFDDDWEYYDHQLARYSFDGGKSIIWDGQSCNGMRIHGRGRGALIYGTEGSALLDREAYILYDKDGKEIAKQSEPMPGTSASTQDTSGFDHLTVRHIDNFVKAIQQGEQLNAPIDDASISTHLCHLGNISQDLNTTLKVDAATGKILENEEAMKRWARTYQTGWEPTL